MPFDYGWIQPTDRDYDVARAFANRSLPSAQPVWPNYGLSSAGKYMPFNSVPSALPVWPAGLNVGNMVQFGQTPAGQALIKNIQDQIARRTAGNRPRRRRVIMESTE